MPLFAGEQQVVVGHRSFDVFWPPRQLDIRTARRLQRAVDAVHTLADGMDRDGYPDLRRNLDEAYRADVFKTGGAGDSIDAAEPRARAEQPGEFEEQFVLLEDDSEIALDVVHDTELDSGSNPDPEERSGDCPAHGDPRNFEVPPEWESEYRAALLSGRRASNDVSLILGEDDGRFAAFGDARWGIQKFASVYMKSSYEVLLAPHHGTYRVPLELPRAHICVSQAGRGHVENWSRHRSTHGQWERCINTQHVGTVSIR
ncbi:hypothetical protein [Geodermatophilus sp. DSM 45219]|uniref:hypothetical protein n=1 Tax=Geodermatophilus sp. DSM 45219 TaxID=1881103 RepID=UPI00116007B3|nr:hypothetical protein [Geodermatophilus sp. DSM 45219]